MRIISKSRKETLRKSGKWLAAIIFTAVIMTVVGSYLPPFLPFHQSEQPLLFPNITTDPSPNPIINTDSIQTVSITVTPDFKPPYSNYITVTILNPNSYKCYMTLELEASAGFCFLPITHSLPPNVTVEEGYEYKNIMKLYIDDFAPQLDLKLDIPVYTMNPATFNGTEQITTKVLAMQEEK